MHTRTTNNDAFPTCCKPKQLFRLRFQQELTSFLFRRGSVAEGFGIIWEKTLEHIPLQDQDQAELYRELIAWAKRDELFTGEKERELLAAWRETVHEF